MQPSPGHRRIVSDPDSITKRRDMIRLREPLFLQHDAGARASGSSDSSKRARVECDEEAVAPTNKPHKPSKLSIESRPAAPSPDAETLEAPSVPETPSSPPTEPATPNEPKEASFDCGICCSPMTDPSVGGGW